MSERTLLPVLMPLAAATTLVRRFPEQLTLVLKAHGIGADAIAQEVWRMGDLSYAKTANRSVVAISLKLAETPCSPLRKGPVSPDSALWEMMKPGA